MKDGLRGSKPFSRKNEKGDTNREIYKRDAIAKAEIVNKSFSIETLCRFTKGIDLYKELSWNPFRLPKVIDILLVLMNGTLENGTRKMSSLLGIKREDIINKMLFKEEL